MSATDRKIEFYMERNSRKWGNQSAMLFEARKRINMKQKDIVSFVFCKEQQYSAWERGVSPIPARHIRSVCRALIIKENDLSIAMARDYQKILLLNAVSRPH